MNSTNVTLFGYEAIAYAERFGVTLSTDSASEIDVDEARTIASEDASLVWIEVPAFLPKSMLATFAAVGNDGTRPVVWGLGTSAEMAFADALEQYEFDAKDAKFLRLVTVGPEVQARVQEGDVSWRATGTTTSPLFALSVDHEGNTLDVENETLEGLAKDLGEAGYDGPWVRVRSPKDDTTAGWVRANDWKV